MMKKQKKKLKNRNKHLDNSKSGELIKCQSRIRCIFSIGWKLLAGLALILGLVVTMYDLSAHIEISSSDYPVDSHKPFSSPFDIKNCSTFSIYNVQLSYGIINIMLSNGSNVKNMSVARHEPLIKQINAGESTAVFCAFDDVFRPYTQNTIVERADVEVRVRYKPAYLPWSKIKSARFITIIGSDGYIRWIPKAISE